MKEAAEWAETAWDQIRRTLEKWRGGDLSGPDPVESIRNALDAYARQQVEAHQAMVRELAEELDGIWPDPCAHMMTVKAIKELLAHPLVQQAREERRDG